MGAISREALIELAEAKVADARMLFAGARYSNAYYLFGYGLELGLKACIANQFQASAIPDKNFVNRIYTHRLEELAGLAGLKPELDERKRADPAFDAHWAVVSGWSEEARYEMINPDRCAAMSAAFADLEHGIWTWLKDRW